MSNMPVLSSKAIEVENHTVSTRRVDIPPDYAYIRDGLKYILPEKAYIDGTAHYSNDLVHLDGNHKVVDVPGYGKVATNQNPFMLNVMPLRHAGSALEVFPTIRKLKAEGFKEHYDGAHIYGEYFDDGTFYECYQFMVRNPKDQKEIDRADKRIPELLIELHDKWNSDFRQEQIDYDKSLNPVERIFHTIGMVGDLLCGF